MPNADYWDEEDEWYTDRHVSGARHVRPPPRKARDDGYGRRSDLLFPEQGTSYSSGLHRTRSQGHAPTPNVTIYNTTRMDNESSPNVRTEQRSPLPSPRGRPLRMADEYSLENELADLRLEVARNRRSRSRSVHHHHREESPSHNHDYDRWQLQMANERLKEAEEKALQERREDLLKKRYELKYFKDKQEHEEREAQIKAEEDRLKKEWDLKLQKEELKRIEQSKKADDERKRIIAETEAQARRTLEERKRIVAEAEEHARRADEERKRIVAENTLKIREAEAKAKAEQQAVVDAYNKKRDEEERKEKAEKARVILEYERKKSEDEEKEKRQREELLLKIKIEEEKQKAKKKEEYDRFMLELRQKEEEEKAKKKKQEDELEDQMRKRLAHFGFQENQIQAMIKPEEAAKLQQQQGMTPHNPLRLAHQPTYVKVHKEHLAIDTLSYYDIPYEYDRNDPNYIIILREMDPKETEILFEHTRRLRTRSSNRLLIEERNDHGRAEYAWVRRRNKSRSPSVSRRRSSPKRVIGIKEMFQY